MTSTRSWLSASLLAAFLGTLCVGVVCAQDPGKDESLDKLLEKLENADKPRDSSTSDRKDSAKKEADKKTDDKKPSDKKTDDKKPASPDQTKPKSDQGKVDSKDKDLDKLLEGLGQTPDKPAPDDKKPGGGQGKDDSMPPPNQGGGKKDNLKNNEQDLDQRLEEITGKKPKPKNQKERNASEESGPLGQVVKEMRDVEQRLCDTDTGEATRKKQSEIVKNLDKLIESVKNSPSQSMAMRMVREGKDPGQQKQNQPNPDPSQQPGAMAQGAQPTRPKDPNKPPPATGLDKSIWGQLPAQIRDLMGNAESETPLPARLELIRRYYLSLGNKSAKAEN